MLCVCGLLVTAGFVEALGNNLGKGGFLLHGKHVLCIYIYAYVYFGTMNDCTKCSCNKHIFIELYICTCAWHIRACTIYSLYTYTQDCTSPFVRRSWYSSGVLV